jgi:hypothetical protein
MVALLNCYMVKLLDGCIVKLLYGFLLLYCV